ncbi:unnamed protein product [Enterobius vermicularis]|uniref:Transmembrane protein n=1 Tax=Enterobius vermicularis TaxID=51028 RepID=A0A0N4VJI9_ENTVE|nr:unnamed protein product [Enterobius vermicularis]
MFSLFLPPEEVSDTEQKFRNVLNFMFRLIVASVFSYQCFTFLFSPLWMHGYIWALNQANDKEMNRKGAGAINAIQLQASSFRERICLSISLVLLVWLLMLGFRNKHRSVWYLLKLSACISYVGGMVRCLQMKQRLFSLFHEGFYLFFVVFFIGNFDFYHPLLASLCYYCKLFE